MPIHPVLQEPCSLQYATCFSSCNVVSLTAMQSWSDLCKISYSRERSFQKIQYSCTKCLKHELNTLSSALGQLKRKCSHLKFSILYKIPPPGSLSRNWMVTDNPSLQSKCLGLLSCRRMFISVLKMECWKEMEFLLEVKIVASFTEFETVSPKHFFFFFLVSQAYPRGGFFRFVFSFSFVLKGISSVKFMKPQLLSQTVSW